MDMSRFLLMLFKNTHHMLHLWKGQDMDSSANIGLCQI